MTLAPGHSVITGGRAKELFPEQPPRVPRGRLIHLRGRLLWMSERIFPRTATSGSPRKTLTPPRKIPLEEVTEEAGAHPCPGDLHLHRGASRLFGNPVGPSVVTCLSTPEGFPGKPRTSPACEFYHAGPILRDWRTAAGSTRRKCHEPGQGCTPGHFYPASSGFFPVYS